MGRILAIDYGQKRTGLAVTDELRIIAGPLETVPSASIIPYLRLYFLDNVVDCIVVGEPRDMRNRPSEAERFIAPFVRRLIKEFPDKKIVRYDERFTSLMASRTIREAGLRKSYRQDKALVDKVSAVLILNSYLDSLTARTKHP